ncbi:MAG: hypothetical protein ABIO70_28090, partial [Pseudomonadota bacterium]
MTLAVDVAGKKLQKGAKKPSDLVARIKKRGSIEFLEKARVPKEHLFGKHPSLTMLLDESMNMLNEADPMDDLARRMLLVGGWFAPTGTDLGLLGEAAQRLIAGEDDEPEEADE